MLRYNIDLNKTPSDLLVRQHKIGVLQQEDSAIKFQPSPEYGDFALYLTPELCGQILKSRNKGYYYYEQYISNQSWKTFYDLIVFTVLYLDYLRKTDPVNRNEHESKILTFLESNLKSVNE